MENVKIILLDIDNTLIDFRLSSREALSKACSDLGLIYDETFFKTFHTVNNRIWKEVEDGKAARQDVYDRRFREIFEILGIGLDPAECEKRFRYHLRFAADHVPGAERMMKYLYGKYKLYVASNSTLGEQESRLRRAGFFDMLDGVFISSDLGASKPHPEFFAECLKRLGDPPKDEVVLIGDSPSADVRGGIGFGIRVIWFDRGVAKPDPEYPPTYTVRSLEEIEQIL